MMLLLAVIGFGCVAPGLQHRITQNRPRCYKNVNTDFYFPMDFHIDPYPSRTPLNAVPQNPIRSPENKISSPTSCSGPDLQNGFCTRLEDCEPFKDRLLKNPSDSSFINELKKSNQQCGNQYAVICCPTTQEERLVQLPSRPGVGGEIPKQLPSLQDGCGYRKPPEYSSILVVGGVPSELGAWPWIALIGYNDKDAASPFKCGGTLITSRHILTAAHCIKSNLAFVRLGEHDLSVENETQHIDIPVSKVYQHLNYNSNDGHSDIAILLLDRNIQLSLKINPICLPSTRELLANSLVKKLPTVAGWGRTMEGGQPSDILQELRVPVQNNSVCKDLYQKQNKLISQQQFDNAVLCAGNLDGGEDTCQGDSGGPLMISEIFEENQRFSLIGVVSYGIGCARPNSPGVYTRVTHFMDWITDAIKKPNLFISKQN